MPAGPETRLVARIRAALLDAYPQAWVMKVHGGPYQDAGVPDLIACLSGRLVALEVKAQRPGESEQHARDRTTLRQRAVLDELTRAGAVAAVVLSVEEALEVLSNLRLTEPGGITDTT